MLGWHRTPATDGLSHRIAAIRDDLDALQSALRQRQGGLGRLASEAQDWISERADGLPHLGLPHLGLRHARRHLLPRHLSQRLPRHLPTPPTSLAVAAAALAVGVGVGCVLYALASGGRGRPASASSKDDVRRPASRVVD